ncbi:hypothetical protein [Acrocarpospora pleiomorpha]|uniref:hypothetical protein n=1 Tax=Acrocarpospora pleiomorpha TaxID=90975 RepID=UPI0014790897|nr:hypothetical protein [Acrocarpospora pleiomorpha]
MSDASPVVLPLVFISIIWTLLATVIKNASESTKSGSRLLTALSSMATADLFVGAGFLVLTSCS